MFNTQNPTIMKQFVFVYGTLQSSYSNHGLLAQATPHGLAQTVESYVLRATVSASGNWGIPFVGKSQAISAVHGEVYEVDAQTLEQLDRLESCNMEDPTRSWYHRELVPVVLEASASGVPATTINAWVYFNEGRGESIVTSGRWHDAGSALKGDRVWYFAYGSNQDFSRMLGRDVAFDERCVGALPGYKRVFNKRSYNQPIAYANVAPADSPDSLLRGVLYRTTSAHLASLDKFEGAPRHYARQTMAVQIEQSGEWVDAIVYVAQPEHIATGLPVQYLYRDCVTAGADLLGEPSTWADTDWPTRLVG